MYVVVFEILQREKSKEKVPGLVQLVCIILGFSTLMLVEVFGKYIWVICSSFSFYIGVKFSFHSL